MNSQQVLTEYLSAFINGLKSSGVQQAVISPGSRSTSLALLLHREPAIQTFVEVDERSAAFFALGLSKTSEQPVALVCTSGTAAANYYPAICEANASHVPLVVLTTDRPHELRQVGAPQAMDQLQLFQSHVKLFVEMALPETGEEMLNYAFWQGARSGATAQQVPMAPVHFNFPLREPLLPDLEMVSDQRPPVKVVSGENTLSNTQIMELVNQWQQKKGVLVVGGTCTKEAAQWFIQLAQALNWPLIADPLANVLTSGTDSSHVLSHSDLFANHLSEKMAPEVVVRFGQLPVAKNVMLWLKSLTAKTTFYLVDANGQWQDQLKRAQTVIHASETSLIQQILSQLEQPTPISWLNRWKALENAVQTALVESVLAAELNEMTASLTVHQQMVAKGQLFVSNSMPIRYLDRFMTKQNYRLLGNRGINGIDGIVSTALGMTAVAPERQNILLIGDLAMYHDMNGLLLAKRYGLPLTIVLLNNNGGGIFSFLSQRTLRADDFEPIFGTPIDLDFSLVAQLYGAEYTKISSLEQLKDCLVAAKIKPKFQILEVTGSRQANVALYEKIITTIAAKIESLENA